MLLPVLGLIAVGLIENLKIQVKNDNPNFFENFSALLSGDECALYKNHFLTQKNCRLYFFSQYFPLGLPELFS